MRRKFILHASLLMLLGYVLLWFQEASSIRDHVEQSLLHLRQELKKTNANMRIQWDDISLHGFPFSPSAVIQAPTLSMVYRGASYLVGLDQLYFVPGGFAGSLREGVYSLQPNSQDMRAIYAEPNQAPELYHIEWDAPIYVKMLAFSSDQVSQSCSQAARCMHSTSEEYPLSHFRVELPPKLLLLTGHNNEYKPIEFRFNELQRAAMVLERKIPADMTFPLQIFLGMLREAHVYQ